MKKISNVLYIINFIIISLFYLGCEDLIEENIEKAEVEIVSPPDNYVSTDLSISLQWEEVEGADEYNLQVWNEDGLRLLNEIVDTTAYDYTFPYFGTFTWKVRAENSATVSPYTIYTIVIDSTDDISTTTLSLTSPDDNYYTNEFEVTFEWESLYNAEDYRFELTDLDEVLIDNSIITTDASLTYTFTAEGDYIWWVRAQNASSNTSYSSRYITIDTTAPNTPALTYPVEEDTITSTSFTFSWDRGTESGSPIYDSLFVASDSLFSTLLYSLEASDDSYELSDSLANDGYFWFVRSFDSAGNESSNSDTAKFVVSQ
jgi:hypothetical protein